MAGILLAAVAILLIEIHEEREEHRRELENEAEYDPWH